MCQKHKGPISICGILMWYLSPSEQPANYYSLIKGFSFFFILVISTSFMIKLFDLDTIVCSAASMNSSYFSKTSGWVKYTKKTPTLNWICWAFFVTGW